jgi:hypothetical protein
MRSVADAFRADTLAAAAALTPAERIAHALALGDADVRLLAKSRGLSNSDARRAIALQHQHLRVRSACHESLLA